MNANGHKSRVAQTSGLPYRRFATRGPRHSQSGREQGLRAVLDGRSADCKSAIRQAASLRYIRVYPFVAAMNGVP
jgi:hypothetical protein